MKLRSSELSSKVRLRYDLNMLSIIIIVVVVDHSKIFQVTNWNVTVQSYKLDFVLKVQTE